MNSSSVDIAVQLDRGMEWRGGGVPVFEARRHILAHARTLGTTSPAQLLHSARYRRSAYTAHSHAVSVCTFFVAHCPFWFCAPVRPRFEEAPLAVKVAKQASSNARSPRPPNSSIPSVGRFHSLEHPIPQRQIGECRSSAYRAGGGGGDFHMPLKCPDPILAQGMPLIHPALLGNELCTDPRCVARG